MKTALSFFIFFIACWPYGQSAYAQNPVPAFSSAGATAEILTPASMEMKQTQEFNILDLPALILNLALNKKNGDSVRTPGEPLLTMNLAEFTVTDFSSQQFALTMPLNASGLAHIYGKPYLTSTNSLSIIAEENVHKTDRKAFKVKGTLSFNEYPPADNKDAMSPMIVTVNFN